MSTDLSLTPYVGIPQLSSVDLYSDVDLWLLVRDALSGFYFEYDYHHYLNVFNSNPDEITFGHFIRIVNRERKRLLQYYYNNPNDPIFVFGFQHALLRALFGNYKVRLNLNFWAIDWLIFGFHDYPIPGFPPRPIQTLDYDPNGNIVTRIYPEFDINIVVGHAPLRIAHSGTDKPWVHWGAGQHVIFSGRNGELFWHPFRPELSKGFQISSGSGLFFNACFFYHRDVGSFIVNLVMPRNEILWLNTSRILEWKLPRDYISKYNLFRLASAQHISHRQRFLGSSASCSCHCKQYFLFPRREFYGDSYESLISDVALVFLLPFRAIYVAAGEIVDCSFNLLSISLPNHSSMSDTISCPCQVSLYGVSSVGAPIFANGYNFRAVYGDKFHMVPISYVPICTDTIDFDSPFIVKSISPARFEKNDYDILYTTMTGNTQNLNFKAWLVYRAETVIKLKDIKYNSFTPEEYREITDEDRKERKSNRTSFMDFSSVRGNSYGGLYPGKVIEKYEYSTYNEKKQRTEIYEVTQTVVDVIPFTDDQIYCYSSSMMID
jgi:hypothetical protein